MDFYRQENYNEDRVKNTVLFFVVLVSISFCLLFARLFYLQVVIGEKLKKQSEDNRLRDVTLDAYRGKIVDRNGVIIADIKSAYKLMVIIEDTSDLHGELGFLANLLDIKLETLKKRIKGKARYLPILLKRNLSRADVAKIEEHKIDIPGFYISFETQRNYPNQDSLSHVIGYIGEINTRDLNAGTYPDRLKGDSIGKAGVERLYENELFGAKGKKTIEVDSAGRELSIIKLVPPASGTTLSLTIDLDLQKVAEEAMKGKRGAVVAMNPTNGEVLAFLSYPDYNPNDFSAGISTKKWRELANAKTHPLNNRVIQGVYPPGSIHKIVVGAAGLEERTINPEQKVFCNGKFRLGNRTYRCWKKTGHGNVNFHEAIKMSCDVYFYKQGLALGIDKIAYYAKLFGLGSKTGINLPHEERGLVPSIAWKKRARKQNWIAGETISAAIGQGYNLVTPLQIAVMTSVVANGGYRVTPKLLLDEPTKKEKIDIKSETFEQIAEGLRQVVMVSRGTARRARVKGIQVAGKTGTAQVVGMKEDEDPKDVEEVKYLHRDHAWFTSYAPFNAPEIVVTVIVEHGGHGGSTAAPIAQKVIQTYMDKKRKEG